jgi:hypothetical protein
VRDVIVLERRRLGVNAAVIRMNQPTRRAKKTRIADPPLMGGNQSVA